MAFTQREARRIIRKAIGRVPQGEDIRHLNIMPMMDMMTALIVAFIFQAAVSATQLTAGTVSLPKSLTADPLTEGASTLIITPTGIVVEGKSIVPVRDGDVDAAEKNTGSLGLEIPRLTNFLAALHQQEVQKMEQHPQTDGKPQQPPELLIIADRMIPYRLLVEVMFSAKQPQAGYKHFRLIVQKQYPITPTPKP